MPAAIRRTSRYHATGFIFAFLLLLVFVFAPRLPAQLAITEVMSAPSVNSLTQFRGPEYWELTNFSTNDVNLHGYGFRDGVPTRPLVRDPFTNLVIRAGESIVFFRVADAKDSVTNTSQFRAWWGEANLRANLQCRIWKSPGLSGWDGDSVVLFDSARRLVDTVQFGRARLGRAFTYEPETGLFDLFSVAGVNGAFSAALTDDVGSPGSTTGSVPLRFEQHPANQSVDAGMTVTFTAVATGLPRPQYQWFANGLPVPSATDPGLALPNVRAASAGLFQVVVTNGLAAATSVVATLTVNTNPAAPFIITPPADTTVFEHQTAVFNVFARGLPVPSYQWQSNNVDIPGSVASRLEMRDARSALSGMRISVRVWNLLGATNVSATLTVTRRPDLRFTEVMALPSDEEGNRRFDWFELTNYDTNAIDLTGWRFSDQQSFARAFVITNALTLQPGESAVFAERLNERLFGDWWGRENLPAGLKFCTYSGFGLGYLGEQLFLWNAAAMDPNDSLSTVSWAAATRGVSFECEHWCDPEGDGCLDEATSESKVGLRGAFRAADAMDVGSPGYIANPLLRILSVIRQASGAVDVRCRVTPGRAYRLRRAPALSAVEWEQVATGTAFGNVMTLADPSPETGAAGFYRVEEAP
jgi:hypothetical protein